MNDKLPYSGAKVNGRHIFMSYAHADMALAESLEKKLHARGETVLWDRELRESTAPWDHRVHRQIIESCALVVIVTNAAAASDQVCNEVAFAQENKKPIIPLFVGGVDPSLRLLLTLGREHQVRTAAGRIEDRAVEEIKLKLDNLGDSLLEPIALHEDEIPSLGSLTTAMEMACGDYFRAKIRDGRISEAARLLSEMRNCKIIPRPVEQFGAAAAWISCSSWYVKLCEAKTWPKLVKQIADTAPSEITSPEKLRTICPPVATKLNVAFWKLADQSLEAFENSLGEHSLDSATAKLAPLESELLQRVAHVFEGAELLSRSKGRSLIECAKVVVEHYGTPGRGSGISIDNLQNALIPPEERVLRDAEQRRKSILEQAEPIREFAQHLTALGSNCSAAAKVLALLKAAGVLTIAEDSGRTLEQAIECARSWRAGLDELSSSDLGSKALLHAAENLNSAARVFRNAGKHAECVRLAGERAAAWVALQNSVVANGDWPQSFGALEQYRKALDSLHKTVVEPLATAGFGKFSQFLTVVDSIRSDLDSRQMLYSAVGSLLEGDYSSARSKLQKLQPGAQAWTSVCDVLAGLEPELARLAAGELPADSVAAIIQHRDRVSAGPARSAELQRLWSTASAQDPVLKHLQLPQSRNLVKNLERAAAVHDAWALVLSKLEQGRFGDALDLLNGSPLDTPSMRPTVSILGVLRQADTTQSTLARLEADGDWAGCEKEAATLLTLLKTAGSGDLHGAAVEALETRVTAVTNAIKQYSAGAGAEQQVREAVAKLEDGDESAALVLLSEAAKAAARPLLQEIQALRKLAAAVADLRNVLGLQPQITLDALIDKETGLLSQSFESPAVKVRLTRVSAIGDRIQAALSEVGRTRFPCHPSLPDGPVLAYASCLRRVLDAVDHDDWSMAATQLTQFMADQTEVPDAAWLLLGALKLAAEAPTDAESCLAEPEHSTTTSHTALLCALGAINRVTNELRTRPVMPHNLGAAVLGAIRRRKDAVSPDQIRAGIGVAALFACSPKYRQAVSTALDKKLPQALTRKDASVRGLVSSRLRGLLATAGKGWGRSNDPNSWASHWDVECFAVTQMSASAFPPLPWPFGPALIDFFGLQKQLSEAVTRAGGLRIWYGPCAAGAAMNLAGDPEGTLACLPRADACTLEMARSSAGYAHERDPVRALRQDADRVRVDALFSLLNRQQFTADMDAQEIVRLKENVIRCIGELLDARQSNANIDNSLVAALRRFFSQMVAQLEEPLLYLHRPAKVADADARKSCMDGVLDFLESIPNSEWLNDCILAMKSFRCDLLRQLVDIKFEDWVNSGEPTALHSEMIALTNDAIRDDPRDANACLLKARLLLRTDSTRSEGHQYLAQLHTHAAGGNWPAWVSQKIQDIWASEKAGEERGTSA